MEWAELKELCQDGCPECGTHVFKVRAHSGWIVTELGNQLQFRPERLGESEYYVDVQCHNCGHLIEPQTNTKGDTHGKASQSNRAKTRR